MICTLRTQEGMWIGTILFAFNSATDAEGDCLIRAFPPTEHLVSEALFKLQEMGEFHWKRSGEAVEIFYPDRTFAGLIKDESLEIDGVVVGAELSIKS